MIILIKFPAIINQNNLFFFFLLNKDDVSRKVDSDSDLCLEAHNDTEWNTSIEPVSFHQPNNLNYTVNPCYQPNNNAEFSNPDEPYVILNLHRR